jgi:septin family protein
MVKIFFALMMLRKLQTGASHFCGKQLYLEDKSLYGKPFREFRDFKRFSKPCDEQIHLVWYVVQAGLKRFEHFDAEIIAHLKVVKAPTIIVISQADLARENEMSQIEETIENYQTSHKFGHIDIIEKIGSKTSP